MFKQQQQQEQHKVNHDFRDLIVETQDCC